MMMGFACDFFIAGIVLRVFDCGYWNTDDTDLRNLNG